MNHKTVTIRFQASKTPRTVYEMQIRSLVEAVHLAANDYELLEEIRKELNCIKNVIDYMQGNLYLQKAGI